jgi:hypothetical protein
MKLALITDVEEQIYELGMLDLIISIYHPPVPYFLVQHSPGSGQNLC